MNPPQQNDEKNKSTKTDSALYFQFAPVSKMADGFFYMYTKPIKIDKRMREKSEEKSLSLLCTSI